MQTRTLVFVGIFLLLLASAAVLSMRVLEPVVGVPGGKLAGAEQQHPGKWDVVTQGSTIQLETRPADPYSVNLWGVGIGPDFYVATDAKGTRWSANLDANPFVRLRLGTNVYPLLAVPVVEAHERQRVLDAYVAKYAVDPGDMATNAGLVFRLDAR